MGYWSSLEISRNTLVMSSLSSNISLRINSFKMRSVSFMRSPSSSWVYRNYREHPDGPCQSPGHVQLAPTWLKTTTLAIGSYYWLNWPQRSGWRVKHSTLWFGQTTKICNTSEQPKDRCQGKPGWYWFSITLTLTSLTGQDVRTQGICFLWHFSTWEHSWEPWTHTFWETVGHIARDIWDREQG